MSCRSFLIITLLIAATGWLYLDSLRFSDTQENFIGDKKKIELARQRPLTQTVMANREHLARVKLAMGAEELWIGETLTLSVMDATCRQVVRISTLRLLEPQRQGVFVNFDFTPIAASRGESYCLSLTYDSPHTDRRDRPTVLAISPSKAESKERRLQLRLAYSHPHLMHNVQELEERLSQYKPAFIKGTVLLTGLLAAALGGLILAKLWKKDRS